MPVADTRYSNYSTPLLYVSSDLSVLAIVVKLMLGSRLKTQNLALFVVFGSLKIIVTRFSFCDY